MIKNPSRYVFYYFCWNCKKKNYRFETKITSVRIYGNKLILQTIIKKCVNRIFFLIKQLVQYKNPFLTVFNFQQENFYFLFTTAIKIQKQVLIMACHIQNLWCRYIFSISLVKKILWGKLFILLPLITQKILNILKSFIFSYTCQLRLPPPGEGGGSWCF